MIDLLGGSIMVELSSWDCLFSHTGDVKGSEEGSNADTWAFHPWSCVSNTLAFKRARHWLLEVWLIKLDNHLSTHFTEFSQFSKNFIFSSWRESNFVDSLIPFEYRSLENSTPGEVIWRGIPKEVVWLLTYFLLCLLILGRFYEGQKALSWPHNAIQLSSQRKWVFLEITALLSGMPALGLGLLLFERKMVTTNGSRFAPVWSCSCFWFAPVGLP